MNEKQPARDDYSDLARRLGFDKNAARIEGPVRGPHAGPSDETPLEKLHRLSALMESVATEIGGMRSATYRAQLWQQWAAICQRRPEYQRRQKRLGSASGESAA
jgi:hypothetical protein